jgi:hypothetical protein
MPNKSKKHKNKPQGHYCKVCGEHKANEKFSGNGHAAHICKACMSMSPAERSEQQTLSRITNTAFRFSNEAELKWLRNRMNDKRPEVREAAREAHSIKFPRYERNQFKKGLTIREMEFYIHGEVMDEWGDKIPVRMRFFLNNRGIIKRIDYNAGDEADRETEINIGQIPALKFLKAAVHQYNAPFWHEDIGGVLSGPDGAEPERRDDYEDELDYLCSIDYIEDGDGDSINDNGGDETEDEADEERGEPSCSLRMVLNKTGERIINFYDDIPYEPQELFMDINSWFEPDEPDFEDEDEAEIEDSP